jgi:hypothetical protein
MKMVDTRGILFVRAAGLQPSQKFEKKGTKYLNKSFH